MTGDGQRVNASVVEIKPDIVVVDLNHPLAGADLIFEGEILESRPATNEEIQELVKWWVVVMAVVADATAAVMAVATTAVAKADTVTK